MGLDMVNTGSVRRRVILAPLPISLRGGEGLGVGLSAGPPKPSAKPMVLGQCQNSQRLKS